MKDRLNTIVTTLQLLVSLAILAYIAWQLWLR